MSWEPIILTLKLALIVTFALLLTGLPLAFWLTRTRSRWKPVIETLVSMPLVLPPTVLGFYFLLAFSPNNSFGAFLDSWFDIRLVFSFGGLVIASMLYSLPFMVHPLQSGLASLPKTYSEASALMGHSAYKTLLRVLLPNIRPSLITGVVLTFAHTIGEFGVVLMIGGSIPGRTRVASIAIYDRVEALDYAAANVYSLFLFAMSFLVLLLVYLINGGYLKRSLK